jgi:hypothetical protein
MPEWPEGYDRVENQNRQARPPLEEMTIVALRAALRQAVDLLVELRDCPLTVLEVRQTEIDRVVAEAEQALPPTE